MENPILKLLNLYREKRKVDGLNGRMWHASRHWEIENEIQLAEETWGRHLTSHSSGREKDPAA